MADQKITDLTAIDALASGDLFAVVDDPAGTPASKKATVAQVQDFIEAAANSFTAAQTITPTTDAAALTVRRNSSGQSSNIFQVQTEANGALASIDKSGNVTGGTYNKVTVTAPASGSTLTIADGKTLTANSTLTLAGTDSKTLTVSNSLTLAGTDSTTMTFPSTSTTVAGLSIANLYTAAQTFHPTSDATAVTARRYNSGATSNIFQVQDHSNNVLTAFDKDGKLKFNGSTSGTVTIQPAAAAGTYALTLPTDDGTTGQYLKTDGSGVLSWDTPAGGGGTPGGSDTQIQFNDGGSFGGDADLTWNKTTNALTLTSGSFTMTGNISAASWTTNDLRYKSVAATLTDTSSAGTVATTYTNAYGGNTIAASNARTFTDYFTTFISEPTAGTNVTFTNKWALGLSGNLKVTGGVTVAGGNSIKFNGSSSGVVTIQPAAAAGTYTLTLPTDDGTTGQFLKTDGSGVLTWDTPATGNMTAIGYAIDGGGATITTGVKGVGLFIPYACTINSATILADQTGSIVIDIWKDSYANYPPTVADSITASAPLTISSAVKAQDATLTGWTTSVAEGDILRFNVNSVTSIQSVVIVLKVTKT